MIKTVWLPSWYPNRTAPFDGDFIQRTAKAVSAYAAVQVFFVTKDEACPTKQEIIVQQDGALTETIAYYKTTSIGSRLLSWTQYFALYKQLLRNYIKEHGVPDVVHVQVPIKAGLLALWLQRTYGVPYVCTEHFAIYNDEVADRFSRRSFYFKYYTQKVFGQARALLPVSKNLGEAINARVLQKPFTVIANVVDTSLFFYTPTTPQPFRFVHVSEMGARKNVPGIIHAFCSLYEKEKNSELVLAGPYPPAIYQAVERSGLLNKAIFFTGQLRYAAIAGVVQQGHALLLFSNSENMPCVILEALCCGLPIISTKTGGIAEVVNESNGLLVPVRDEAALLQAMQQMVAHYDRYNRSAIAQQAQTQFSYAEIGKQINAVYEQVTS